MKTKHTVSEPPKEVWVVSDGSGQAEFVANFREGANDHANEAAEGLPEEGPYRLCKYIAEPFANAAPELLEALQEVTDVLDAFGDLSDSMMHPGPWGKHQAEAKIKAARAAIAKATGEPA